MIKFYLITIELSLNKLLFSQTDNLCQFLPQDKVYDFSKLNPRELLGKTVAAFGEPELKADHEMYVILN